MPSFAQIRAKLSEPSPYKKQMALYDLVQLAKQDTSIHPEALPIFERYLDDEYAPAVSEAIRGIAVTRGLSEAKERWLALLTHPDAAFVRIGLSELGRAGDPALLAPAAELLRHSNMLVRRDALTALAGIRTAEALQILAGCLEDSKLRPYAIDALSKTGDRRAIALLEPCLKDTSPAWPLDNHGPMMSVGDVSTEGLDRLRKNSQGLRKE